MAKREFEIHSVVMKATATRKTRGFRTAFRTGILCGTDFSHEARHAVRAAGAIARRIDEPLMLVHAVEIPRLGASGEKSLMASRRKELRQEAEEIRKSGAQVEESALAGRPDEVLVSLARAKRPRLLVVSSIGRRGAERWLLGSVSERTAERALTPTLVVRDARPLVAWAGGERPLKVFVCFNFTVTSEAALRWVKELQAIGPCDVVLGYVDWPAEQRTRLGGGGPLLPDDNPRDIQAVLERDVQVKADELLGKIPFRIRVDAYWGRPDARLAEMAKEEDADLVVVGSHQYQGFERLWHTSVSRGLLHQAAMSVALVPLAADKEREAGIAPPVRRVLVTTDFSELGNAAIPHAYSILRGGGTVHLVHVIAQLPELPGGRFARESSARSNTPEARHVRECAAQLRALIPAEAGLRGIITQIEVVRGRDVAETIYQSAERLGADVICLGTHGRSGLLKALIGSVAQKVMALSRRPLFVVRPPVS